ncbi:MAG: preprotein translocase subunit SecE [Oscillospiraceae bacterium]|jgi:preprotein translocase subunit SecE|nr:preprotein translocase subunit SecE [Oscillospiraceae bacterium]
MSEQEKRDQAAQKESVSSDKKAKAPKKKDAKKPNRVLRWLKDLKGELKKVTWPSAKDVVKNVGIVIVCVLIVGACIWVFDALAHAVLEALLRLFGK